MLNWAYHHKVYIWIGISLCGVWNALPISDLFYDNWVGWSIVAINFLLVILACFVLVQEIRHKPAICIECINRVPTDAAYVAMKKARNLRNYHAVTEKFLRYLIFAVLTLSLIWVPFVTDSVFLQVLAGIPVIVYWVGIGFHFYNTDLHNRVQSFCPYCKDGNDDTKGYVVGPPPQGTKIQ